MDRNAIWILVTGLCLTVSGCAMNSCHTAGAPCGGSDCGPDCGADGCSTCSRGGRGLMGRRCSDCTPPWVPTFKYIQCIDDLVVCETGKNCGLKALARYRRQCRCRLTTDFSAGFVQAYIDLAEGRGPLPPNLPPSRYWTAYYRSCAGQPKVEQWYAGYNAGLEDGLNGGVSQFRRIDVRMTGCP
jgi:hypothetical protein